MKPNFALDLSHEGINFLHRGKGGWTLVGTVALDDPSLSAHLAELRRIGAELAGGELTSKIIIPDSQILYTTLEAPGPDDIAREVQIRSGLDGRTPYPVGELVFDWRADGERARVAVLARETMDEAETFAVEHKFNPVSFVARPERGAFSGEPFFGKTRVATKILGSTARVDPDASPVPRRARAAENALAPGGGSPPHAATAPAAAPRPTPRAEPAPPAPGTAPPEPAARPGTAPSPDPDDKFAELDALAAELSGDPSATPSTAPTRARNAPSRKPQSAPRRPGGATAPPALPPFPPLLDDADQMPAPAARSRTARGSGQGKARTPAQDPHTPAASATGDASDMSRDARSRGPAGAPGGRPPDPETRAEPRPGPSAPIGDHPDDDLPAQPGVAFSTRRTGNGTNTVAAPTAADRKRDPAATAPPTDPQPAPRSNPLPGGARREMSPADRRRAKMADAMARPLPRGEGKPTAPAADAPSRNAGTLSAVSGALRGATQRTGGLRGLGQRRDDETADRDQSGSSIERLMREQELDHAQLAPSDPSDPGEMPDASALTSPTDFAPDAAPAAPEPDPKPDPASPRSTAKTFVPTPPAAGAAPATVPEDGIVDTGKDKRAREAEAMTVFGARGAQAERTGPKYLGIVLTLLLLLVMAIIAFWSGFFVNDGEGALFNPGPEVETPAPEVAATEPNPADTAAATDSPAADAGPAPTADTDAAAAATPIPEVLSPEDAQARYTETGIWQRAPESIAEPRSPQLEIASEAEPQVPRSEPLGPALPEIATDTSAEIQLAAALPPPPPGTNFDLDENGLIRPTPEGAVSPAGVIVYAGRPALVPPPRPQSETGAEVEAAPLPDTGETPAPPASPDLPDIRPQARPEGVAAQDDAALQPDAAPQTGATPPDTAAAPVVEALVETAAAIDAAVEDAVEDAVAARFADASELAVAASPKPIHRPGNIANIVEAAFANASDGTTAAAASAPAAIVPAIPTSANVANQATTSNALNLRQINLIGISGTSNARRALIRMPNGRYVTVRVGDRLDGGQVTSITADQLTYQKGSRAYALEILPLG